MSMKKVDGVVVVASQAPGHLRVISGSALTSSWSPVIDLGRPTLRGVRKCPKCGTVNGTRGTSCKNKECRIAFSRPAAIEPAMSIATAGVDVDHASRKNNKTCVSPEAVRIITGNAAAGNDQVYSVRVRSRGPDYRGFVQLPNLSGHDASSMASDAGETEVELEATTTTTTVAIARCFVDTCVRFASESDEVQPDTCQHVKATLCCDAEAVPLALKNTVLNGLHVASEVKQAIWLLATESPGPLVQRVSKTVMVVKCRVDPRHPLGFLHFSIYESNSGGQKEYKFICTCKEFRTSKSATTTNENMRNRRCVHFYACICAFASDEKLSKEFSHYVNADTTAAITDQLHVTSCVLGDAMQQLIVEAGGVAGEPDGVKAWEVVVVSADVTSSSSKKLSNDADDSDLTATATSLHKRTRSKLMMPPPSSLTPSEEESKACVMFVEWLGSVTESVNQAMHYGSNGRPEPLVFLAPQLFFDCLQSRIAAGIGNNHVGIGNRKRRLPNVMTTFERTSPPLGVFSKYTWHINSVAQVKRILDTPQIPLEIIRNFIENRDGTYAFVAPCKHTSNHGHHLKSEPQPASKPLLELQTYLKVGYTNPEDKQPSSFTIEWIADILPKSKIGELSLRFEYGHQRNGQIERRSTND